jgi:hypothetical protein
MDYDLVGVSEAATMLGISRQRVTQIADTGSFPPPVADLAAGRIWRRADVALWAQTNSRRGGRPRGGYRIEFGSIEDKRNKGVLITLNIRATDDADIDATFLRSFDRGMVRFVLQQLNTSLPPDQARLSLERACVGLATRQLAREIEESGYEVDDVPRDAPMTHRWFQYLPQAAASILHPIPDLRADEVTHLWLDPSVPVALTAANALVEHAHMECGHWIERSRILGNVDLFLTKTECPSCGQEGRVVGLWPQR